MPRGPSLTAEWVCALRVLERARPPAHRVLDDPLAERFLRPPLRRLLAWLVDPPLLRGLPASWPRLPADPVTNFIAARHRCMDDALVDAARDGVEQVVLLGAGYDTRAWRFADVLGDRPVWELDFPATQARKRAILARQPDLDPDRIRFVPVDFIHQDFAERLVAAGFPIGARTLFIWEGVSMYLDEDTVARTLESLRRLSSAGSRIVADFWYEPAGHPLWILAHRYGARMFGTIGEPLRFQLDPSAASAFLARHGFRLDTRLDTDDLAARYAMGGRILFAPLFLAHATAV